MLHTEAFTPESKELFPLLSHFKDEFYLAGGTAFALQVGHRISVDFDLFSPDPIKRSLLKKVEAIYAPRTIEILINDSRELTMLIGVVKHTFLHYPFASVLPYTRYEVIDLLSPKEILATKAYTIGRRGSFKDYVDLYIGLHEHISTLQEVIDLACKKYAEGFNDRLFLEQLLYLDDIIEDTVIMFDRENLTKKVIVDFFSREMAILHL